MPRIERYFSKKIIQFTFIGYILIVLLVSFVNLRNSHTPLNEIYVLRVRADFYLHIIAFLPWAFFVELLKFRKLKWLLLGIIFAIITELIQYFLPYRSFYLFDLLSNIAGVILGYVMLFAGKKLSH
jgi:glycopeptide antibiotics resistance protein